MHKVEIARLIAFKVAHQWFSNAISPSSWFHFWLHDGLAALYGEEAIVKVLYLITYILSNLQLATKNEQNTFSNKVNM